MKIIRFIDSNGRIQHGAQQPDGSIHELAGDLFSGLSPTGRIAEVKTILAPLMPTNLICVGLNYRRHAEELKAALPKFPVVFFKSTGALQNPGGPIVLPRHLRSDEVDYECELAIVIGKAAHNVPRGRALEYVAGYTCANDVSARDWQIRNGGSQWCRGKSFDTFAPLGPCIVTADEIPDPNALRISTTLNGTLVQDWTTRDMIFDVPTLIEFLSGSSTLIPGTVILTGTPHGVGMGSTPPRWLKAGDVVTIEIEKIGALTNPVVDESTAA